MSGDPLRLDIETALTGELDPKLFESCAAALLRGTSHTLPSYSGFLRDHLKRSQAPEERERLTNEATKCSEKHHSLYLVESEKCG